MFTCKETFTHPTPSPAALRADRMLESALRYCHNIVKPNAREIQAAWEFATTMEEAYEEEVQKDVDA